MLLLPLQSCLLWMLTLSARGRRWHSDLSLSGCCLRKELIMYRIQRDYTREDKWPCPPSLLSAVNSTGYYLIADPSVKCFGQRCVLCVDCSLLSAARTTSTSNRAAYVALFQPFETEKSLPQTYKYISTKPGCYCFQQQRRCSEGTSSMGTWHRMELFCSCRYHMSFSTLVILYCTCLISSQAVLNQKYDAHEVSGSWNIVDIFN